MRQTLLSGRLSFRSVMAKKIKSSQRPWPLNLLEGPRHRNHRHNLDELAAINNTLLSWTTLFLFYDRKKCFSKKLTYSLCDFHWCAFIDYGRMNGVPFSSLTCNLSLDEWRLPIPDGAEARTSASQRKRPAQWNSITHWLMRSHSMTGEWGARFSLV